MSHTVKLNGSEHPVAWHPTLTEFLVSSLDGPPVRLKDFSDKKRSVYALGVYGWAMLPKASRAIFAGPEEFISAIAKDDLESVSLAVMGAINEALCAPEVLDKKGERSPKKATRS